MITNFRIYEFINQGKPDIGDYVICKEEVEGLINVDITNELNNFLLSNIGKVIGTKGGEISEDYDNEYPYLISYEKVPRKLKFCFEYSSDNNARVFGINEIEFWSKDKKDLESIISAKKYNL